MNLLQKFPVSELGDTALIGKSTRGMHNYGGRKMTRTRLITGRNFRPPFGTRLAHNGNVRQRRKYSTRDVARGQAQILLGCYGALFSPAKQQSYDTGQSERACRNQQRGLNCMSLTEFFNACHAIPELRDWGARMMGLHATNDPSLEAELRRDMREVKAMLQERGMH